MRKKQCHPAQQNGHETKCNNYGRRKQTTAKKSKSMDDAQEETKEGMIAEEYQYAQKENITAAEYKEHFHHTIKAKEEAWQEEEKDDQRGWDTALEEEEEKMHDN
eukprot:1982480-Ditylum_brightwellii.AAC.1